MRSIQVLVGVVVLGLACVTAVRADIPGFGPRPVRPLLIPPPNAVPLQIEADDKAKEPRLIVPKSLCAWRKRPRSLQLGRAKGHASLSVSVALTLSFTGVGLCLMFGRLVPRTLLLVVILAGVGGTALWANAPPLSRHFEPRYPTDLPLDGVAVEIVETGDTIRLILPRPMVAELAKKLNAVERR